VIGKLVEREVRPISRRERLHFEDIVGTRCETDQSSDDEIVVAAVEIMLAVIIAVVPFP